VLLLGAKYVQTKEKTIMVSTYCLVLNVSITTRHAYRTRHQSVKSVNQSNDFCSVICCEQISVCIGGAFAERSQFL